MTLFKKFEIPPAKTANIANSDDALATLATLAARQPEQQKPDISGLATLAAYPSLLVSMTTRAGHVVYVATDDKALASAPKDQPVFSAIEIEKMKLMAPEMVDVIVHTKAVFPGSVLEEFGKAPEHPEQPEHNLGTCYWSRTKR